MDVSELAGKLLILFFPGILCAYIVDSLTVQKPKDISFFLLKSYVFGMASYFLYWLGIKSWSLIFDETISLTFLQSLNVKDTPFSLREIAFTTLISIASGLFISALVNNKIHFRVMQKLNITHKFAEQDVWGFTFNSEDINWVTVRDLNNNLVYDGWYQAFSDNSMDAELLLRDVSVYKNDTGEKLYQVGALYVSRNRADITLEFRDIPVSEDIKWQEEVASKCKTNRITAFFKGL
jgi:hypothetical protein